MNTMGARGISVPHSGDLKGHRASRDPGPSVTTDILWLVTKSGHPAPDSIPGGPGDEKILRRRFGADHAERAPARSYDMATRPAVSNKQPKGLDMTFWTCGGNSPPRVA